LDWPDPSTAFPLGDGYFATATDTPSTVDELCAAITLRTAQGLAVYPQGGATSLDYGTPPRRPGAAIITRSLNHVIDYPAADMTITIEAGMTLAALQSVLAQQGQRLPLDAPQVEQATLGGIYATNSCGPRRYGWGRPRDLIIGVSFVTAAGRVVKGGGRVVKNVAGYDFPKLLTGSMGSLGVIVQMTLKVRPIPESYAFALVPFTRANDVAAALEALNTSGTRPVALELLNRPAAVHSDDPLRGAAEDWLLVIGFEGNTTEVSWQLDQLGKEHGSRKALYRDGEAGSSGLWSQLAEFPARSFGPVSFVANLRPSDVVDFAVQLDAARWAVQCHAGNGIVRAHLLSGVDLANLEPELAALRTAAVRSGGNLILARCPTEWKARLPVWGAPRADWPLMEQLHAAVDPDGVMNPGRFVGTI
jgi:glycolate oxidase FAD binding subunit